MGRGKPRFNTLQSWSYSVYTQYIKCPFSVCLEKIQRVRIIEPPNPNLEKGNRVHAEAAKYVSTVGKKPLLSSDLTNFKKEMEGLRKGRARVEHDWAFTRAWSPTAWLSREAWLRIKVDVCLEETAKKATPALVHIVDYKTGRLYPEHRQQRTLYALGALQLVKLGQLVKGAKDVVVRASHWYTDSGQTATEEFALTDLEPLKKEWSVRIKEMMNDKVFPTRTGSHCNWCKFAKSKGGPCPEDQ